MQSTLIAQDAPDGGPPLDVSLCELPALRVTLNDSEPENQESSNAHRHPPQDDDAISCSG